MIKEFDGKHKSNLSQINGILISIDEYLMIMKNTWDFRLNSNRAPAIIAWKNLFVNCKENLTKSFDGIMQNVIHLYLIKSATDETYKTVVEDLATLLPLTSNIDLNSLGYNTVVLNQSNAPLFELMKQRISDGRGDINKLISQAIQCQLDYSHFLSELENAKTYNYESMGLLEQILFNENNELGRTLTNYILTRRFDGLSVIELNGLLTLQK